MVDQNGRPKIKFEYKLGWNSGQAVVSTGYNSTQS